MDIGSAIKELYPNLIAGVDYQLQDDSDGKGPYIRSWNNSNPRPTEADLERGWLLHVAEVKKEELRQREEEEFNAKYPSLRDFVLDVIKEYPRDVPPGDNIPVVSANRDKRDRGEEKIDALVEAGATPEEIQGESWETVDDLATTQLRKGR